jgi:hypothetical protein
LVVQPVASHYTDCAIPNENTDNSSSSSKNNNTNSNNKYRTVGTARAITLNVNMIFLQVAIAFNEDLTESHGVRHLGTKVFPVTKSPADGTIF